MKRSAKGDQVLDLNFTDFERASGGKKVRFSFSDLVLNNGRSNPEQKNSPLAADLILALQENKEAASIMNFKQYEFAMNINCQLTIRNTTSYLIS